MKPYYMPCYQVRETTLLKDAWTLAIEALSWIELQNLSEKLALSKTAKQLHITNTFAKGLAHKLVCETMRKRNLLDRLINHALAPRAISDFDLGVRAFLRLYAYETKTEPKRDVHKEAVEIARMGRSILEWETLQPVEKALGALLSLKTETVLRELSDDEKTALQTCHPSWFVKYCFKLFGRNDALKLLESGQTFPPVYVRLNTLKSTEEKTLEALQKEDIQLAPVQGLKDVYKITKTKQPLASTKSFKEGLFYVQDKASCLAAEVTAPEPGMTVFDVCAAPGAKTTHLAMLMQNKGAIFSLDYSKRRMNAWKQSISRMGVENATPIISDACQPLPLNGTADIVILDPPCTSTGVFARTPSAKWRLSPRSIRKMAEIQWQMLRNSADKVKEDGWLIYSTCSITVEENEMQIERFLKLHLEFKLCETKPLIGQAGLRGLTKCQRLYPHMHECNGFFIAKLQRKP
jgi:16S rRNA (cytosine967-C5)-methyltransferase